MADLLTALHCCFDESGIIFLQTAKPQLLSFEEPVDASKPAFNKSKPPSSSHPSQGTKAAELTKYDSSGQGQPGQAEQAKRVPVEDNDAEEEAPAGTTSLIFRFFF